jgi:Phosphotransferase enzyme family
VSSPGPPLASPAQAVGPGQGRLPYLRETCDLLWPAPATVTLVTGSDAGGMAAGQDFLLLLGTRRPRLLVPASRRAAGAAVRGYGEPGSPAARAGARLLSLALTSGAGPVLVRSRLRVHAPPGTSTIETYLRDALGSDLLLSLYLGPARANRKPVLQLLTPRGRLAGFAKIGTRPLTRALVHAEHAALTRLGRAGLAGITVPQVLHYGEWRGMNVLVLSPLPVWLRRRPVTQARLTAAMTAVALVDGRRSEPLAGGSYWQGLTGRLAAADGSDDRDTLLGALDSLATRAQGASLALGCWHGDWTPWNMASTSKGLLVWDWERFTAGVPLGFDALHYRLQAAVVPGRQQPRVAAARCIEDAPAALAAFGLCGADARLTATLYLADLATRYLADRQAQAGAALGAPGTWLIPAITEQVRRL